jgi:hypothetical protein
VSGAKGSETAVQLIAQALERHPNVPFVTTDDGAMVAAAEGGFDVSITEEEGEQMVSGGLWHEHFHDASAAADWFLWLLTPATRIVEKRRRGSAVSASLERLEAGTWVFCDSTSLLFQIPFLPTQEVILQNRHILRDPPKPAS